MANLAENICTECSMPRWFHVQTWIDEITDHLIPVDTSRLLPKSFGPFTDYVLEKVFSAVGLVSMEGTFPLDVFSLRTRVFIEELQKKGIKVRAMKGPAGFTHHCSFEWQGRTFRFSGVPSAEFSPASFWDVDDKIKIKKILLEMDVPVATGKSFWFWQKRKAAMYAEKLGYPVVVKPRNGSGARHVTTDIQSAEQLSKALALGFVSSPTVIVEKYFAKGTVHRATVIKGEHTFCVQQIPAHVDGDGVRTIAELFDDKNENPNRGVIGAKHTFLFKLLWNKTTDVLLGGKGYTAKTIPAKGERVFLQKDTFMRLGGDLEEKTDRMHPDNKELFQRIARKFGAFLVGIDFLVEDISRSWKEQECAVLELNGLPCIEMHHFPTYGKAQNVAKVLVEETLQELSNSR